MTYQNSNSLSDNLEVDLLRSMIVIVSVTFSFLSFFLEEVVNNPLALWIYFVVLSPFIFLFTLSLKKYTTISLILLSVFLILTSLIVKDFVFYNEGEISIVKIIYILLHFISINFFFWKASRTLRLNDVEADLSMLTNLNSHSNTRKLTRRKNRRDRFRANNTVKLKSGQYRG